MSLSFLALFESTLTGEAAGPGFADSGVAVGDDCGLLSSASLRL